MQNANLTIENVLLWRRRRVASLHAQAPDFSGTWRLDETKSKVVATAGIIGLIPAGAPKTLHITQPANGTRRDRKPDQRSARPHLQAGTRNLHARGAGRRGDDDHEVGREVAGQRRRAQSAQRRHHDRARSGVAQR